MANLKKLFYPKSVAVIGASRNSQKIGNLIFKNLAESDFAGQLYPINPNTQEVLGQPALASVLDLSEPVDLAIIVVPAETVAKVLTEVGQSGTKVAIIISAGFAETGPAGQEKQEKLLEIGQKYHLKILGPNCLGVINPKIGLNASWGETMPKPGKIAFASQSGALAAPVIELVNESGLGFSYFASLGNKADIDETDLLEFFGQDKNTDIILTYLESFKNGPRLVSLAQKIASKKPIIVLKAGQTTQGAKSAQSHTASLATPERVGRGIFTQANIISANSVREIISLARLLTSLGKKQAGPKTAIVTNAGGPGVLATDAIVKNSLSLSCLGQKTVKRLGRILPASASLNNPVDILGDADEKIYFKTSKIILADPEVDNLIIILTKQRGTNVKAIASALVKLKTNKPIIPIFMGGKSILAAKEIFQKAGFTNFYHPQEAIIALAKIISWQKRSKKKITVNQIKINRGQINKLINQANRPRLNEAEGFRLLSACQVNTPKFVILDNQKEGITALEKIGCPAFLKVLSADLIHKTELGAIVKIDFKDDFPEQFNKMNQKFPSAKLILSQGITGGIELIIGVKKDPVLGRLIMIGAGGIYTEILKDSVFRILPIGKNDAREMISELKIHPILKGARGSQAINLEAVEETLLTIAKLAEAVPKINQLEINPLIAGSKSVAVDVKISLVQD
ncbi:MAG: acetate--CoA ligase family protein [Candidatus Shapirobacteria bacterium]|nr:acetate--CoA ligase family protein [Candidatus Shapirobacteria bacterium]MDD5073780.1 acetate--CoA ligase family protein [Candidatus Shapirobacteria bacterium]MDD5481619.1 acetate--CoA ligase family protein [Candidatus Shapirobacteria bacterium]